MYQIKIVLVICFVRNDKLPCYFVRKMAGNITSYYYYILISEKTVNCRKKKKREYDK